MFDSSIVTSSDSNSGPRGCRRESAHKSNSRIQSRLVKPGQTQSRLVALICACAVLASPVFANFSAPPKITTLNAYNCSQINLNWMAATDNGKTITNYTVLRNGTAIRQNGTGLSYSDTGLAAGTSYSYVVRATDNVGATSDSTAVAISTTALGPDTTAPTPAGGFTASAVDSHSVALSWTPAADSAASCQSASGLQAYQVYRGGTYIASLSPYTFSFSDNGLSPSTSYGYQIKAIDNAGNVSSAVSANATTPSAPQSFPPGQVQISLDQNGNVVLSWAGTPGVRYQAQCAPDFAGPWQPVDAPTTSFTVSNICSSPLALFRIANFTNTPQYVANYSLYRSSTTPPSSPSGLAASADTNSITLSWGASAANASGLANYLIYRNGIFLKSEGPAATSSVDYPPTTNTYTYAVGAMDNAGNLSSLATVSAASRPHGNCKYTIGASSSPTYAGNASGGGTVNCNSSVTVNASPNAGYNFASWTENGNIVSLSASYNFTATANRNLVANFSAAPVTYNIGTSSSPAAGGSTSGGGTYNSGSTVTVTAYPNGGYNFSSWTENGSPVSYSASYSFSASANRNLVANFSAAPVTYNIGTSSSPAAGGSTSGGGTYNSGSTVTVTAYPNGGYNFSSWTENGSPVSYSASYSFSASANRNLVANFITVIGPPTVPVGLGATAPNCTNVNLSWIASTDVGGPGIAGYKIYRNGSFRQQVSGTSWTDGSVVASTTYSYTVSAIDTAGRESSQSSAASVTTPVCGGVPGPLNWFTNVFANGTVGGDQAIANSVVADHQGNVIVVGQYRGSVNLGDGVTHSSVGGNAAWDAFIVKYTPAGKVIWAKSIGGTYDDMANGVTVDSANNIIVTGQIGSSMDLGGGVLANHGGEDIFVVKYSPAGGHIWSKCFGETANDWGVSIAVDSADNIIVGGVVSYGAVDFGGGALNGTGQQNTVLVKLNSAGSYVWSKRLLGAGIYDANVLRTLAADRNGDVVIGGYFTGTDNFGGGAQTCVNSSGEFFLAKYSGNNGAFLWSKVVGGAGFSGAYGVATDPSTGDIVVTGTFSSPVDFGTGTVSTGGGYSIFVARYASSGNALWVQTYGGNLYSSDSGAAVAIDSVGRIGITGQVQSMVDFGGGWLFGNGSPNYFALTLTSSGQYLWAKRVQPAIGMAAAFDSSLNFITAGYCGGSVDFGGGAVNLTAQAAFGTSFMPQ